MAKYVKRPVIVDAEQWFPGKNVPGVHGDDPAYVCACALHGFDGRRPHVHTAHGRQGVYLEPGDWVIAEPDGRGYYPCKPDIFAAMYEPLAESE